MARDLSYDTLCSAPPFISDGAIKQWLTADDKARINALLRLNVPRLARAMGIDPIAKDHGDTCRRIARWYKNNTQPKATTPKCTGRCQWTGCTSCHPPALFAAREAWLAQQK